jgi:thiol-disulfide isomerase/thioredoxin
MGELGGKAMRDKRILTMVLFVALLVIFSSSLLFAAKEEKDKLIGTEAKDFTLPKLFGDEMVTLSGYEGKSPVVIDFFETWSPACRKNLPLLEEFYTKHDEEVEVFYITTALDRDVLEGFFGDEENKISFDVLHDKEAVTVDNYPHSFIPFMVIIDTDGVIIGTSNGYDPDLVSYLEGVLGFAEE